jgi:hypothetical protein
MRTAPLLSLALLTTVLAACSVDVHPRIGSTPRPDGIIRGDTLSPLSPARMGMPLETRRVCRAAGTPSGWIAVQYLPGGSECPRGTGPDSLYNAAIIERHANRPVGTIISACADQAVPFGWQRLGEGHGCEGANVRDDRPTSFRMQRIR